VVPASAPRSRLQALALPESPVIQQKWKEESIVNQPLITAIPIRRHALPPSPRRRLHSPRPPGDAASTPSHGRCRITLLDLHDAARLDIAGRDDKAEEEREAMTTARTAACVLAVWVLIAAGLSDLGSAHAPPASSKPQREFDYFALSL